MSDELTQYVSSCRTNGWTDDQIKNMLIENGYTQQQADHALTNSSDQTQNFSPPETNKPDISAGTEVSQDEPLPKTKKFKKIIVAGIAIVLVSVFGVSGVYAYLKHAPLTTTSAIYKIVSLADSLMQADDYQYWSSVKLEYIHQESDPDEPGGGFMEAMFSNSSLQVSGQGYIVKTDSGYDSLFDTELVVNFLFFNNLTVNLKGMIVDDRYYFNLEDSQFLEMLAQTSAPSNTWISFDPVEDDVPADLPVNLASFSDQFDSQTLSQIQELAIQHQIFILQEPTGEPTTPKWRTRGIKLTLNLENYADFLVDLNDLIDLDEGMLDRVSEMDFDASPVLVVWYDIFSNKVNSFQITLPPQDDFGLMFSAEVEITGINTGKQITAPTEYTNLSELFGDQMSEARDTQRRADLYTITNSVYQYATENNGNLPAGITETPTMIGTCADCLDLGQYVVPAYVAQMPLDPSDGTEEYSGYMIYLTEDGRVNAQAMSEADPGETISVLR